MKKVAVIMGPDAHAAARSALRILAFVICQFYFERSFSI